MTLSDYFMSHSVFMREFLRLRGFDFKNNCVKSNKHRPILSVAKMFHRKPGFWQYKVFVGIWMGK